MKVLFSLIVSLSIHITGYTHDLQTIRRSFHAAVLEVNKVPSFYSYIYSLEAKEGIVLAYQAMSEALVAQTAWNPLEKYTRIKKFEELISKAIINDPNNLEIRFLRLCIENYIPEWLGIPNHLLDDKSFILTHLEQAKLLMFDRGFIRYIDYFIKETGLYSATEIQLIENELKVCMALSQTE